MIPADVPLGTDLLYGACWEDLAVARTALRVPAGGLVVTIASAGDNAIGLLLDDPRRIVAVDLNPAQTALTELKLAAVRAVPGEVARFVGGMDAGGRLDRRGAPRARLDTYAALRRELPGDAARWWDAHPGAIAGGVIHAGRFERYLRWFRQGLLPLVPGRRAVREMLAANDTEEQRRVYRRSWDTPAWRALFRFFFGRRLLAAVGRHPAFFRHTPAGDVGDHYLARAEAGLTDTPIRSNPYATFILSGAYRLPDAAPDYLCPRHAGVLAGRADRLTVWTRPLLEALRDLPARSVDAFYLSDVFELADTADYEECLAEVARTGKPGARVCYWNNLVERSRPDSLAGLLAPQVEIANRLHAVDRAFLYSRLVVEEVRPAPGIRARARIPVAARGGRRCRGSACHAA